MAMCADQSYPGIVGYTDRLSVRPGERLALKASTAVPGSVEVDFVRIGFADPNPEGPGMRFDAVDGMPSTAFEGRYQRTALGSYGVVPLTGIVNQPWLGFGLTIQSWRARREGSTLLSCGGKDGWALTVLPEAVVLRAINGSEEICLPLTVKRKFWYRIEVTFDARSGEAGLAVTPQEGGRRRETHGAFQTSCLSSDTLYMAAQPYAYGVGKHFNGRLEDVAIRSRDETLLAFWDFSIAIETLSIVDTGPLGLHGHLVNLPTRGVRGSLWDGSEHNFAHAPRHYAAVHFHEDDVYDCSWETDLEILIPENLHSGIYGIRMRRTEAEDVVPFFVKPGRDGSKERICYLANTFTYQAYGNHARDNLDDAMQNRMREWGAPTGPDSHPQFGFSTYNFHPDGTGTAFSSRLRPLLTMRPGFLTFATHEGSGLRHFSADSHLVEWFQQMEFDFDVVTDEDLHDEGADLIKDYSVIVTGSHPEYHTARSLNALRDYRDSGGNLVYLGGNGFYWRIAKGDSVPGAIEVRRAEGGIRAWAAEPGEGYQALDGGYGGLWRRNGRPPQELVGVGFSAQGLFEGTSYQRTEASYDPDVAWIFDGVNEERIGDYGFSGGGAAGFELDRADPELGTPESAVVVARSHDHSDSYTVVPEEILSHIRTVTGEPPKELIRSELLYMRLENGAQVFSTGSITFCGSLPHNNFSNGVSRLLYNVVRRFAGETV